jgi:Protein phosphatase 2C
MWNVVHASVPGTSHVRAGVVCQDASRAARLFVNGSSTLVLVCSDGAGSASLSNVGSSLACEEFVRGATALIALGVEPRHLASDIASNLCLSVQQRLQERAEQLGACVRDLACTLVAAIIGDESAAFVQVGDGGIVVRQPGFGLRPVFWPETGEYINTTFFISDPDLPDRVRFSISDASVREIALFTDGLQMLCLKYGDRSVHEPFFEPMFRSLRIAASGVFLTEQLCSFLNSVPVNSRTDDDKTLILGTRPYRALAAPTT